MILVTGASGTIGGEVVRLLAAKGEQVRAMIRSPNRAGVPAGVEVVRGDFDEPSSLEQSVAGATALFLLSAPGPSVSLHDQAMLGPARDAGVSRVVKVSSIGSGETGNARVGAWHRPGEQAVQASGMAWTLLRPAEFASNTLRWADPIRAGDPVPNMTGVGTLGVVDPRDVAAVAVESLISDGHEGQAYTLTGPELLSVPDRAVRLGQVLGRAVRTVEVPLDVAREQMLASGMNASFVDVVIDGLEFIRSGHGAVLTGDVERVLGRPPHGFDIWVQDHRDAFAV
jgi:uncharacterized protein YbjT (DUF2867 family)